MTTTPLTVLDLVPISSGSNATQALRNSIDLAQQTERLGYTRYWITEHHLNPGVAGTSPAVVLALTAAATSTIRLGSGAVDGYRAAFRPSAVLDQPYVSVSADVVVADTEAAARELATGYGLWVRSIRTAEGAIQFPTPEQARRHVWSDADRELVADRIHDHADRVRSYQLLAEEWARR